MRVNTTIPGGQREPAAAMSARVSVIVWSDDGASAGRGIFGQRYDATGRPVGVEFRVDAEPGAPGVIALVPDVAMNASGASVVVWEVSDGAPDPSSVHVFARRYDRAGRALGARVEVSTVPSHRTSQPAVAMDASGAFAVVWHSGNAALSTADVLVRRFSALGAPDSVVQVSGDLKNLDPDIAMAPSGASVVTWSRSDGAMMARRYDAGGGAEGDPFQVNALVPGQIDGGTSVAMDAAGAFVVVWQTASTSNSDYGLGIRARWFSAPDSSAGSAFDVSPGLGVAQGFPAVAAGPGGDAVVVWQRTRAVLRNPARPCCPPEECPLQQGEDVLVQRFGPGGRAGPLMQANGPSVSNLRVSTIAMDAAGNALVAWDAVRPDGQDLDVYTRRYRRP